jgi:hypothetical protein
VTASAGVIEASVTNDFGYNLRSEVTTAAKGTNLYGDVYDPWAETERAVRSAGDARAKAHVPVGPMSLVLLVLSGCAAPLAQRSAEDRDDIPRFGGARFAEVQSRRGKRIFVSTEPVPAALYLYFCVRTGRATPNESGYPGRVPGETSTIYGEPASMDMVVAQTNRQTMIRLWRQAYDTDVFWQAPASCVSLHDAEAFCDYLNLTRLEQNEPQSTGGYRLPTRDELVEALSREPRLVDDRGMALRTSTPFRPWPSDGYWQRPYTFCVSVLRDRVLDEPRSSLMATCHDSFVIVWDPNMPLAIQRPPREEGPVVDVLREASGTGDGELVDSNEDGCLRRLDGEPTGFRNP